MQKIVAVQNNCFRVLLDAIQLNVPNCMVLVWACNWHAVASTLQIIPVSYSKTSLTLKSRPMFMHFKSTCIGLLEWQFPCCFPRAWEDGWVNTEEETLHISCSLVCSHTGRYFLIWHEFSVAIGTAPCRTDSYVLTFCWPTAASHSMWLSEQDCWSRGSGTAFVIMAVQ